MQHLPESNASHLMRLRDVQAVTTLSRTALWRLRSRGLFPQPLRLPGMGIRWRRDEVLAWIDSIPRAKNEPDGNRMSLPAGRVPQASQALLRRAPTGTEQGKSS
jgi:predicted DNA-binding transcriptional regulator AlpA